MRTLAGTGDDDPVKDLVSVACDLAGMAHWLNDAEGLRVAGGYLARAAELISEESLTRVVQDEGPVTRRAHLTISDSRRDARVIAEDQAFERYHDRDLDGA
jgi:hypothetical protein